MRRLEKILVMLVVTGLVMQCLQIREGALIAVLAGSALLLFYAAGSYFLLHAASSGKTGAAEKRTPATIVTGIVTGLIFAYTVLAVVCKTLSWPGGQPMVETAVLLLIMLTTVIIVARKSKSQFGKQLLVRSVCLLAVSAVVWFL